MARRINIDLAEIPSFFKGIGDSCDSFCQNQRRIDNAFNLIQESWRDKNAVICGRQLKETALGISKFYLGLCEAVEYVARVCNNRAEYVDIGRIQPPQIPQFSVALMEITNMDDSIINTNPDALEDFKNALDKYVQSIIDNVNRLNGLYRAIGRSWDDDQYEKFGIELNGFARKMQTQIDILDKISMFLKGRIEILRRGDI